MLSKTRLIYLELCSGRRTSQSPMDPMTKSSMASQTRFSKHTRLSMTKSWGSPSWRGCSAEKTIGFANLMKDLEHKQKRSMSWWSNLKSYKKIRRGKFLTSSRKTKTQIFSTSESLQTCTQRGLEQKPRQMLNSHPEMPKTRLGMFNLLARS